jgi:DNA-directed RNA polymerase sigma subunit (sigma70/sigma32)
LQAEWTGTALVATEGAALAPVVPVPNAIARLSPREQEAIRVFYGPGQAGKKLKDLAAELGISSTRARQLEQVALAKLRYRLLPREQ